MASTVTLLSFGLFLVLFLGIGHLAALKLKNSDEDYLLGGRSFGSLFVGLSAGATGNSGFIMIAAVGMGYSMGLSALMLLVAFFIGEWLAWTLFAEKINAFSAKHNSQTVPEMLGAASRSPRGRSMITSLVAIITLVLVGAYTAAQFSASGKALNVFFDITPEAGALVAALVILSYCVTGGLRASIWTDIVQSLVVMSVAFSVPFIALSHAGGLDAAMTSLSAIDPTLTLFVHNHTAWSFLAYMIGAAALGFGFDLSNPQVLVRLLAGETPQKVKRAKWVYLTYIYSTWGAMTFFGIILRVILPEIADPEQGLPVYAMQNFSPIAVGFVLAGIFSVIASTADSQILVCSSALARDVSPSWGKKLSQKFGVRYQQYTTIFVGLITVVAAIASSSTVYALIFFAVGALAGSIGPAMVIAVLEWRTDYRALCITMVVGLLASIAWRSAGYGEQVNEAVIGLLAGLIIHTILMKLFFRAQTPEKPHRIPQPPRETPQAQVANM